jgi:hypothetical protein
MPGNPLVSSSWSAMALALTPAWPAAALRQAPAAIPLIRSVRTRTPGPLSRPTGRKRMRTRWGRSHLCRTRPAWFGCSLGDGEATAKSPPHKDEPVLVQTRLMRAEQGAGHLAADPTSLTPQLMILPLPLDPAASAFHGTADPTHPLTLWMRAKGTPIGYVPVPVPQPVHHALRVLPPDPTGLPHRD